MTNKINQDDINKAVWNGCDDFLSHLSGDEVHLETVLISHLFLSHFLHYPTMGKVVDIGTFRMQNSL